LRESLKTFGWHPELPAIKDEHGNVLIGNRRLKIAADLRIEPKIKIITFGDGKPADAERVKLALASNLGAAPLTPKDRTRIAERLYGESGWTMERIGAALGVTQRTISNDLAGLETISKPPRPKGGRPKGSGGARRSRQGLDTTLGKLDAQITQVILARQEAKVAPTEPHPTPDATAADRKAIYERTESDEVAGAVESTKVYPDPPAVPLTGEVSPLEGSKPSVRKRDDNVELITEVGRIAKERAVPIETAMEIVLDYDAGRRAKQVLSETVSVAELIEKLTPIIKALRAESSLQEKRTRRPSVRRQRFGPQP
jgi:ParB-like chromosome segregation protein Spo0J